jgi:O-succinylbenzoate synthase
MKLTDIHIFKYHLPLKKPFHIGNNLLTSREGAIIKFDTETGLQGFGEAAPLPGLHKENLQDTIIQLKNIKPFLIGTQIENFPETINLLQDEKNWPPSIQFAIESAFLTLNKSSDYQVRNHIFPESLRDKILINTLATGSISSINHQIEQSLKKKYRSIKVKVGKQSLREEIDLIKDIQKKIGESSTLRLDANRSWTFEEAVIFAGSFEDESIEYIEEPLKDPARLPELYKKTGLSIALDETLTEISPENFNYEDWINTLILKPAVLGSVQKSLEYINLAKTYGMKSVISDTFHTGIGLSLLIRLASIIDDPIPMGFDTYSLLDDDILVKRLPVEDGCFDLKTVMDSCEDVDYSKLKNITHPVA